MAKRCSSCEQWQPHIRFYRDRDRSDGLKSQCKDCCRKIDQQRRARRTRRELKQGNHLQHKTRRVGATSEMVAAMVRWQESNRERRKLHIRQRRKHYHATQKQNGNGATPYHHDRPALALTQSHQRRAAGLGTAINDLHAQEWDWLLQQYDYCCAYCGQPGGSLSPDHIIPLARGGANTMSNIAPACRACNLHKGARTPVEAEMTFAIEVRLDDLLEQLELPL